MKSYLDVLISHYRLTFDNRENDGRRELWNPEYGTWNRGVWHPNIHLPTAKPSWPSLYRSAPTTNHMHAHMQAITHTHTITIQHRSHSLSFSYALALPQLLWSGKRTTTQVGRIFAAAASACGAASVVNREESATDAHS